MISGAMIYIPTFRHAKSLLSFFFLNKETRAKIHKRDGSLKYR
jgi:hypothetical protein